MKQEYKTRDRFENSVLLSYLSNASNYTRPFFVEPASDSTQDNWSDTAVVFPYLSVLFRPLLGTRHNQLTEQYIYLSSRPLFLTMLTTV